jgi:hypothetical protein
MIIVSDELEDLYYEYILQLFRNGGIFTTIRTNIQVRTKHDTTQVQGNVISDKTTTRITKKPIPDSILRLIANSLQLESAIKILESNGYEVIIRDREVLEQKIAEIIASESQTDPEITDKLSDSIIEQIKREALLG